MKFKSKKNALVLASLCLISLGLTVTSCGKSGGSGSGTTQTSIPTAKVALTDLSDEDLITSFDNSQFTAYLTRTNPSTSAEEYVTIKGRGLAESGETLGLYIYGVAEDSVMGATVYKVENGKYTETSDITITTDGTVTLPTVTSTKSYRIWIIADLDGQKTGKTIDLDVVPSGSIAKDMYADFTGLGTDARTEMAGQIEKYLLNNGLAPITTMNYGGYQLYSSRLHTPFLDENKYIPGYGYGVLTYGWIDAPLAGEATEAYKMFLHDQVAVTSDTGNFNYLNSEQGTVNDFYSYISSSYFNQYVNEDASGSEYQKGLSRLDAPEAVNPDENGASDTWKVYLRVGAAQDGTNGETKGLSFRTGSAKEKYKAFDKRDIRLEDYLTPFKLMATQSVGWYRGAEQAATTTANRQVKGFAEYYASSGEATSLPSDEEFSSKVGVSIDHTDNSITIQFNGKITPDYAEYQIDGLWSNPICEDFVKVVGNGDVIAGAKSMGISNSDSGDTPLDTMLCVGPYYTMTYESKKTVAYAKNTEWPLCKDNYDRDLYQIAGVHLNLNSKVDQDPNAYIDAFEGNTTDISSIPESKWTQYATDPRKKKVEGNNLSSFFLNTWDQVFWNEWFGEKGTEWEVKPIMANNNFYKALTLGIDRNAMADKYHYVADHVIQEPVNKISPKASAPYNSTDAHKQAILDAFGGLLDSTQYTNWKSNAADYFEAAILEELNAGHYTLGTETNPTVISIDIASVDGAATLNNRLQMVFESWAASFELAVQSHVDETGKNPWVGETGKSLIKFEPTSTKVPNDTNLNQNIIYNGVKVGKYDGQAVFYVSGNGYDVLNNFDKYKSDDSSGFTLNFGGDTSTVTSDCYYNGKYWSFDSLWDAANVGTLLGKTGKVESEFIYDYNGAKFGQTENEDIVVQLPISYINNETAQVEITGVKGYAFDPVTKKESYVECQYEEDKENGTIAMLFEQSKNQVVDATKFGKQYAGYIYVEFVIEYNFTVNGKTQQRSISDNYLIK